MNLLRLHPHPILHSSLVLFELVTLLYFLVHFDLSITHLLYLHLLKLHYQQPNFDQVLVKF